jgi:hypothetical protein
MIRRKLARALRLVLFGGVWFLHPGGSAHALDSVMTKMLERAVCAGNSCEPSTIRSRTVDAAERREIGHWSVERRIRTLANALEATGDLQYLLAGKALVGALYGLDDDGRRVVSSVRDDLRQPPVSDAVRGRVMIGWSNDFYRVAYVSLVQNAVVLAAAARFANLILAEPKYAAHSAFAQAVQRDNRNALTRFTHAGELASINHDRFIKKTYLAPAGLAKIDCAGVEPARLRGCQVETAFAGRELPFNQSLAMGQLALELFAHQRNESGAALAIGLFNHFMLDADYKIGPDGRPSWLYWSAPQSGELPTGLAKATRRRFDDVSHGNIIAGFLRRYIDLQDALIAAAGSGMQPVRRLDRGFLRQFAKAVEVQSGSGGIMVRATLGPTRNAALTTTANVRFLQEWCLLSSDLMAACSTAASQTQEPVLMSYAALAAARAR